MGYWLSRVLSAAKIPGPTRENHEGSPRAAAVCFRKNLLGGSCEVIVGDPTTSHSLLCIRLLEWTRIHKDFIHCMGDIVPLF